MLYHPLRLLMLLLDPWHTVLLCMILGPRVMIPGPVSWLPVLPLNRISLPTTNMRKCSKKISYWRNGCQSVPVYTWHSLLQMCLILTGHPSSSQLLIQMLATCAHSVSVLQQEQAWRQDHIPFNRAGSPGLLWFQQCTHVHGPAWRPSPAPETRTKKTKLWLQMCRR